jgi:hypothetical protein
MEVTDAILIRSQARNILRSCWKRRGDLWRRGVEKLDDFLLFAPSKIATDMLGLTVTEVMEIPDNSIFQGRKSTCEVVGMLNRDERAIVVSGVDAIILGTISPKGGNINLTAKIITTDTAEIVGAAKAVFKADDTVTQLAAKPATDNSSGGGAGATEGKPSVSKSLRELRVEIQPLQVVNDKMFVLTMTITNLSPKKTVWVALSSSMMGTPKGSITDSSGTEFTSDALSVSGIAATLYQQPANGFCQATEIRPGEAATATIKYYSREGRTPSLGQCNLSLEFLLGYDFKPGFGSCTAENFVAKIKTE